MEFVQGLPIKILFLQIILSCFALMQQLSFQSLRNEKEKFLEAKNFNSANNTHNIVNPTHTSVAY